MEGAPAVRAADAPPHREEDPPGDPDAAARLICLRMLERKARSRWELEQALIKREVPGDAARRVLDRFTEVGLIDDAALAESVVGAQHRQRGLARRAVAMKLRERGLAEQVVDGALERIDSADERARAVELVARRRRSLSGQPIEVQTRRLVSLLARKGYSSGLAYEVVREALRDALPATGSDQGRMRFDVDSADP